jgi:cytochrome c553
MLNPARSLSLILCIVLATFSGSASGDERTDFFESRIRPLLISSCVECHGPDKQESNLRLDSRQQVLEGVADTEALVVANNVESSRLMQVVAWSDDDVQMPPKEKLSAEQLADLTRWIQDGAVWPADSEFGKAGAVDADAWKQHWAFQPITDPVPPQAADGAVAHPVDAFITAQLAAHDLKLSAQADPATLARRLSIAIVGLPPAAEDTAIVAESPDAYIEKLLASERFGERWARYWLDLSRYADTRGYVFTSDREYAEAWKYREWVIRALNNDMPYDEFLKRQMAADQFPDADNPEQLAAMGFLTLGRRFLNNNHDIIDDRIDLVARGTMGLTVACARCHDHKFDPIPQADYYSLYGIFDSSDEPGNAPSTLRLVDRPQPREPVIFLRGNPRARGDRVPRQFLTALSNAESAPFTQGSGRMELAQKIASPQNPLTARVFTNRIWVKLFGRGLVESPSDFGVRSDPPTHPELMDYLASYLIKNNWSVKGLIRHIVSSQTYQQISDRRPDAEAVDPENRLLARMNRLRMDFEAHRDTLLAMSGNLDISQVGGPSVDITSQPFTHRRTVYARIDRQNLPGVFRTFDFASPDTHAPKRFQTTVPQQALFQLNNPFAMEQAEALADLVCSQVPEEDTTGRIQELFQRVLRRPASEDELAAGLQIVAVPAGTDAVAEVIAGWQYGYGEISPDGQRVLQFNPFPEFHDGSWRGGAKLPDPVIGWASLGASNGHPGGDLKHCVIRRWVASQNATVSVSGALQHPTEKGDGIHGRIIHSARGLVAEAVAHDGESRLAIGETAVKAGDTLDFVVGCRTNESHDSFTWKIRIRESAEGQADRNWNSVRDFDSVPAAARLGRWAQLAQTLMMTNELVFID